MKRLIVSAIAAVVVLAAATTILWSRASSIGGTLGSAETSLQKPRTAEAGKLAVEEYEDMSMVYSTAPKH